MLVSFRELNHFTLLFSLFFLVHRPPLVPLPGVSSVFIYLKSLRAFLTCAIEFVQRPPLVAGSFFLDTCHSLLDGSRINWFFFEIAVSLPNLFFG